MYFSMILVKSTMNEEYVCNILHHFTVNLTKSALTDMKLDLVKASSSLVTFGCQSQFPQSSLRLKFSLPGDNLDLREEQQPRNWEGSQGKDSPGPAVSSQTVCYYPAPGPGLTVQSCHQGRLYQGAFTKVGFIQKQCRPNLWPFALNWNHAT